MSGHTDQFQTEVTRLLLEAVENSGFVLAGAGAVRAHGLTDRPTEDIDLFAGSLISDENFRTAVDTADSALTQAGFEVSRLRDTGAFSRLRVYDPTGSRVLEVDFAVNWRAEPPVRMSLGLVLSERDAVAGKLSAVYSRGEVREFPDLDPIRASGRYSDADLLALEAEHDIGFDQSMFAEQLSRVILVDPVEAEEYGLDSEAFLQVQQRIMNWATALRDAEHDRPRDEDTRQR